MRDANGGYSFELAIRVLRKSRHQPEPARYTSGFKTFSATRQLVSEVPLHPAIVRQSIDRALARAFPDGVDPWEVPRELAITLALAEGLTAEEALARCGIHVEAAPSRRARVAFVLVPYGNAFRYEDVRYRKVRAKTARLLAQGAPNATPIDGGESIHIPPGTLVEPVRQRVRATRVRGEEKP